LDELLNGGMVRGAVVLISGEPGAGKSTLATQLMLRWSQKRRCVYINTEENAAQVIDRFKRITNSMSLASNKGKIDHQSSQGYQPCSSRFTEEDADVVILDSLQGFVEAISGTRVVVES